MKPPSTDLRPGCPVCNSGDSEAHQTFAALDRRLLALEIIVRGEDGHNGMKSQLRTLCERFEQFEKKAIRWIAVGTSLPGIVVAVLAVLKFIGKL